MGLKRTTGALRERIDSRQNKRALLGLAAVVALFTVVFGTAGADRIAVSAPPPHSCTT